MNCKDKSEILNDIIKLRKKLHGFPELAFQEEKTKECLMAHIAEHSKLEIVDRGLWFYAVWHGTDGKEGIAFRADFDAVTGKDGYPGHYCGHDGHAAILAGFAQYITSRKPARTIYLIFQPAEEVGRGALLCREIFDEHAISEVYGFHNIPGYEKNSILLLNGIFACASTGLEITVTGEPSHAAYPDDGKNPALVIARMVTGLQDVLNKKYQGMVLGTVIGIDLGSAAYGVSASRGILRLTVRGELEAEFEKLVDELRCLAEELADDGGMKCLIREIERFPSTENVRECVQKLKDAAIRSDRKIIIPKEPFRWSEDFGYYLQKIPGAFFGVGDGEEYPQLHTENYCFPDDIIPAVLDIYERLID
ncbi:MAG: amidohydrolase [Eubacteriales bacterium]|nr:amidohydrolase [Eubacteriales bacterium]